MIEALRQVGSEIPDPRAKMMVNGFLKHMNRSPVSDTDIIEGISYVRSILDIVDPPDVD
jgi:hypothetical protein